MAFAKEVLDEILKNCHGPEGIMKHLTKALVERTMEAELTRHLGYAKHDLGEKPVANRRNGTSSKELRTDSGPVKIQDHLKEIYAVDVSPELVSRAAD
ncbi:MAG: transposase [Spirochaetaceae bacterium]|jgi:transposase-like protein|nr:transposase [Spirochaetaceae bacterium]